MRHIPFGKDAVLASARVVTIRPGIKILVLAGPHGVCVGAETPAGSASQPAGQTVGIAQCGPISAAEKGEDGATSAGRVAFGIVPNGNRTATIKTGGGRRVKTQVVANVFYVTGLHGDRGIILHRP